MSRTPARRAGIVFIRTEEISGVSPPCPPGILYPCSPDRPHYLPEECPVGFGHEMRVPHLLFVEILDISDRRPDDAEKIRIHFAARGVYLLVGYAQPPSSKPGASNRRV